MNKSSTKEEEQWKCYLPSGRICVLLFPPTQLTDAWASSSREREPVKPSVSSATFITLPHSTEQIFPEHEKRETVRCKQNSERKNFRIVRCKQNSERKNFRILRCKQNSERKNFRIVRCKQNSERKNFRIVRCKQNSEKKTLELLDVNRILREKNFRIVRFKLRILQK